MCGALNLTVYETTKHDQDATPAKDVPKRACSVANDTALRLLQKQQTNARVRHCRGAVCRQSHHDAVNVHVGGVHYLFAMPWQRKCQRHV